jgi:hypothetical protein
MLNSLLPLTSVLLLTVSSAFSQAPAEKIVSLHLADRTDLVHFNENGNVLSFSRADLLKDFESFGWYAQCAEKLTIGDTLDFNEIKYEMRALLAEQQMHPGGFDENFHTCLNNGNVQVYTIAAGKNLSQLKIVYDKTYPDGKRAYKAYEDPRTGMAVHALVYVTYGNPSF